MMPVLAAALLILQAADSTVRVHGFVLLDEVLGASGADSLVAHLVLPYPLQRSGVRVPVMSLPGDPKRWVRYRDRYVEAEGRWAPEGLAGARIREANPPGMVTRDIEPSPSQRATVSLAVVPERVVRQDSTGQPTGVQPVAYYTLANHGDTQLYFRFTTPEILCIGVARDGDFEARWRSSWQPRARSELGLRVQLGAVVRYIVPIPEEATPVPGLYVARVSLCGVTDYELVTKFVVAG